MIQVFYLSLIFSCPLLADLKVADIAQPMKMQDHQTALRVIQELKKHQILISSPLI
jgi:hypothetical protein